MTTDLSTNINAARGLAVAQQNHDAADFGGLVSMGDQLRRTGFLPAHIKDGVSFAAIVLMGREMGMGTMAACRKLQVIKGTVTERADSQLARFKSAGGRAEFKELSESKAVLVLKHPNGDQHTETFTIEDAKRAGLASNDNYSKHPKAMLRSRAITAGLKSVGWEGAVGIYDPDEIADPGSTTVRQEEPVNATVQAHIKNMPTGEPTPEGKARLAINRANTLDELDAIRRGIEVRTKDGTFDEATAKALVDLTIGQAERLGLTEEVTA